MKALFNFILIISAFLISGEQTTADIMIGVGAPMTGSSAAFGEQLQKGAEEAADRINAEGGIHGEKIKIIMGDDMSDPRQGIAVANKFVADGIKFVIGHFNSGVSVPASEVYSENDILEISPATTHPVFTERGLWNVFRMCGRDDQQAIIAAKYLEENFPTSKIAIIHDKTPYGQGLAEETKKSLNAASVHEVIYEGVNVGDKDFSALIGKIKNKKASIIYWGGLHTEAGLLLRQMGDQNLKAQLVSGDGIVSNELSAIAGDSVIGTLNTFGLDPTLNPENHALIEKFKASGFNPEAYTLYSYASIQILSEALRISGSMTPRAVAKTLKEKGPFKTVLGEIGFNEKGDAFLPKHIMYEWHKNPNGQYIYLPR